MYDKITLMCVDIIIQTKIMYILKKCTYFSFAVCSEWQEVMVACQRWDFSEAEVQCSFTKSAGWSRTAYKWRTKREI